MVTNRAKFFQSSSTELSQIDFEMGSVEKKIKTKGPQTLFEEMKLLKEIQDHSAIRTPINSELWHACAGPLVNLPQVRSLMYYFPQGHSDQETYQRELEAEKAKGANIDENALYYKAVGGTKRDEVYGTGATKEFYYSSSSGSSVCSGSRQGKSMYIVVDELRETVKVQQAEQLKMKLEIEQYRGLTEQIVATIASGSLGNLRPPPTYAPPQPQEEEEEEESESGSE